MKSWFKHKVIHGTGCIFLTTPGNAGISPHTALYEGGRNCHPRGHSTRWLLRYKQAGKGLKMAPLSESELVKTGLKGQECLLFVRRVESETQLWLWVEMQCYEVSGES